MRRNVIFISCFIVFLPLSCVGLDMTTTVPTATLVRNSELANGSVVTDLLLDSHSLQISQAVKIFFPPIENQDNELPVVYLLHGQIENEKMWNTLGFFRLADEQMYAGDIRPMIIVTPNIDNSFGVNNSETETVRLPNGMQVEYHGNNYEDFLAYDLINYVDANYNTIQDRSGRYIGGISMGGYAAIHCAFRHPEKFSKVGGHSLALIVDPNFTWLYPTDEIFENRNPFELAEKIDLSEFEIQLDVGEQDEYNLLEPVKGFYQLLEERGASVQLYTSTGRHNASYWIENLPLYLRFYSEGIE